MEHGIRNVVAWPTTLKTGDSRGVHTAVTGSRVLRGGRRRGRSLRSDVAAHFGQRRRVRGQPRGARAGRVPRHRPQGARRRGGVRPRVIRS